MYHSSTYWDGTTLVFQWRFFLNHQFSALEDIYLENAFISSDVYLHHANECDACIYHKSDAIFSKQNWRGSNLSSLVNTSIRHTNGNLILGHSDQKTRISTVLLLRSLGYRSIYGINVVKFKDIAQPIPIGLTNNTNESDYHRLFGNNDLLIQANKTDFLSESNGLVYGCFSTSTNVKERLPLANLLKESKHSFEEPSFSPEGRLSYLESLRRFAFTACPVGNGIDTHRLWEVLYMGGIPIIKKNAILESMLVDLPFVLVNDWKQITDDAFLRDSWEMISSAQNYNFAKLKSDYWIDLIHSW
jgi:hypothetical protein